MKPARVWLADRRTRIAGTALILAATFALSRLALWGMGVRFDSSFLFWGWQCLDVAVLRDRLWPALVNLHGQPPLFNLFVGVVLKCCPDSFALCFHAIYLLLGLALYGSLYYLLRRMEFPFLPALLLSFAYMIGPSSYLYENWLFYTYPVAVILVLAAVALCRFNATRRTLPAAAFLFLLAVVCLTRSAYHLVYLLACLPLVLVPRGGRRSRVALCAVAATGLVLSLYVKNQILFGTFGGSSWAGMNLYRIASVLHSREDIDGWVKAGALPGVASIRPFSPVSAYRDQLADDPRPPATGAPELTAETKTNGKVNFNYAGYLYLSREYQKAAVQLIRMDPSRYARAVYLSWRIYVRPSWRYKFLDKNVSAVSRYLPFEFSRQALRVNKGTIGSRIHLGARSLVFFLVILAAGVRSLAASRAAAGSGNTAGLVFIFMTLTVGYVALVGNLLDCEENNRFRVETDPLIYLLAVILCRDAGRWVGRRAGKVNSNQ